MNILLKVNSTLSVKLINILLGEDFNNLENIKKNSFLKLDLNSMNLGDHSYNYVY